VETPAKCLTQFAVWRTAPDPALVAAFVAIVVDCRCSRSVSLFAACLLLLHLRHVIVAVLVVISPWLLQKLLKWKMEKAKANRLCRMQQKQQQQQHGELSQLLQLWHTKLLFRHQKKIGEKEKGSRGETLN